MYWGEARFSLFFIFDFYRRLPVLLFLQMKRLLILLSFLLSSLTVLPAEELSPACTEAYNNILMLRFKKAETLLHTERNPASAPILAYLYNYISFLQLMIDEDEARFKQLAASKYQVYRALEAGNSESPWTLYTQAMTDMQWAALRLKFGGYTTAAIEINRAYRLLSANRKRFPDFLPNQTAEGIMQVLVGSVPENYRWVTRLLDMQGTVSDGMSTIQDVLESPGLSQRFPYLQTESLFLFTFISFNLGGEQTEGFEYVKNLLSLPIYKDLSGESPLLAYAAAVFQMHAGNNDEALAALSRSPSGPEYYPFHYMNYLNGLVRIQKLDAGASVWFLRYVNHYKGNSFIKSAYQRLAWIELLNGNLNGYRQSMLKAKVRGNALIDGDRQALNEAESGDMPSACLLKARLLFDGGYYPQVSQVLSGCNVQMLPSEKERLELYYRKARNEHQLGHIESAVLLYTNVIDEGSRQPWYYAANASLQLGLIYEMRGDKVKAETCFRRCLSLQYSEYRTGITQKARAGLSRLGAK